MYYPAEVILAWQKQNKQKLNEEISTDIVWSN